jgi:hypothetical protein
LEIRFEGQRRIGEIRSDPISLVAAEIHLGKRPAGIYGGWLALTYSNRVPVQQFE